MLIHFSMSHVPRKFIYQELGAPAVQQTWMGIKWMIFLFYTKMICHVGISFEGCAHQRCPLRGTVLSSNCAECSDSVESAPEHSSDYTSLHCLTIITSERLEYSRGVTLPGAFGIFGTMFSPEDNSIGVQNYHRLGPF